MKMKQISMVVMLGPKPGIAFVGALLYFLRNFMCKFGCISSYPYGKGVVLKPPANNSTITLFYEGISIPPLADLFLSHGVLTPSHSSS